MARGCPRRSTALGSVRVLAVALALVFAQGPRLLHLLLVPHVLCEHGQLVDAAGTHPHAGSPVRSDGPSLGEATKAGADHDHCDVLAVRHLPAAEPTPWVAAATLLAILPEASLGARRESRPVALLALAPKGSPPPASA